jgi:hypothetical protein
MPGFHTSLTWLYLLLMALKASSASLNMTNQLERRQSENTNEFGFKGFKCDKLYPTLNQIIARYRDVGRKGKGTPTNSAWFYIQVAKSNAPNDLQDMGGVALWLGFSVEELDLIAFSTEWTWTGINNKASMSETTPKGSKTTMTAWVLTRRLSHFICTCTVSARHWQHRR